MQRVACRACILYAALSIAVPSSSLGAALHVPADYPTIQACIDAAVGGQDECVVAAGTYNETINFLGKAIALRSSGGAEVTTIDASGIPGSVVTCANGEGPDTVLDGFTITGGTGTYLSVPDFGDYGGGMFNFGSAPTVTNCRFSMNRCSRRGGGMYNYSASPLAIACTFSSNTAQDGGGISNFYGSPTVIGCALTDNTAFGAGGGMAHYLGNMKLTNCIVIRNTAVSYGAGLHSTGDATVIGCAFLGNSGPADGGGISNEGGTMTIANCAFTRNTAMYDGAGIFNIFANTTVINCTFTGNQAPYGAAIYNLSSGPTLEMSNSIFWGNVPDEIRNYQSAPVVRFAVVRGAFPAGAVDGGGTIDVDPMFVRAPDPGPDGMWDGVDDDYGDLRLQAGSPCINTGDPAFVPAPGETDLDGHARVLCGRVDMGAYEFGIGDYDCDQTVDLTDFAAWSDCMSGPLAGEPPVAPVACAAFDFNADGQIDLWDFAAFQRLPITP